MIRLIAGLLFVLLFSAIRIDASSSAAIGSIESDKKDLEQVLYHLNHNDLDGFYDSAEKTIATTTNTLISLQLKLLYATTVLDLSYRDEKRVEKAVDYMLPLSIDKNVAEYNFILANLLFIQKKYDMADYFLSQSCGRANIDPKLRERCDNLPFIDNGKPKHKKRYSKCFEKSLFDK